MKRRFIDDDGTMTLVDYLAGLRYPDQSAFYGLESFNELVKLRLLHPKDIIRVGLWFGVVDEHYFVTKDFQLKGITNTHYRAPDDNIHSSEEVLGDTSTYESWAVGSSRVLARATSIKRGSSEDFPELQECQAQE